MSKLNWGITVQFVCSYRIQGWGWRDGAGCLVQSTPLAKHCPGGETILLWAKIFPLFHRVESCLFHFAHSAWIWSCFKKEAKKKKKKEEVISDTLPVCFWCFQLKPNGTKQAALAAVCCFPGWQGHLVGRALCASAGREKHALLTSHQGQYFISSPACAYLALMLSFGIDMEFGGVYRQTSFKEQWL